MIRLARTSTRRILPQARCWSADGLVIARAGSGSRATFTVRRIVQGEGVERKFPLNSPRIAKIEVKRSGVVRRAKLYYLRERSGKSVRLRERRVDTEKNEK